MGDPDEATPTLNAVDMEWVTQFGVRRLVQDGEYLFRGAMSPTTSLFWSARKLTSWWRSTIRPWVCPDFS
jgi:hypothetical protein